MKDIHQYLFFMLAGLGVLFTWPRLMMLILFTIMSIFYFYLARFEERKMDVSSDFITRVSKKIDYITSYGVSVIISTYVLW